MNTFQIVALTWKPKQMVGMTLNVEAQELILHTRWEETPESFSRVHKCHEKEKKKLAIIRAPFIMSWHLEALRHRVHLSITGARLTRGVPG